MLFWCYRSCNLAAILLPNVIYPEQIPSGWFLFFHASENASTRSVGLHPTFVFLRFLPPLPFHNCEIFYILPSVSIVHSAFLQSLPIFCRYVLIWHCRSNLHYLKIFSLYVTQGELQLVLKFIGMGCVQRFDDQTIAYDVMKIQICKYLSYEKAEK